MKERLKAQGDRLNALVNSAAISPKGEEGRRLSSIETDHRDWIRVFSGEFLRADYPRPRIDRRARGGIGDGGQSQLDRRLACASLRGLGLRHLEGGPRRADPRR